MANDNWDQMTNHYPEKATLVRVMRLSTRIYPRLPNPSWNQESVVFKEGNFMNQLAIQVDLPFRAGQKQGCRLEGAHLSGRSDVRQLR